VANGVIAVPIMVVMMLLGNQSQDDGNASDRPAADAAWVGGHGVDDRDSGCHAYNDLGRLSELTAWRPPQQP
jgi:hypothetical protein